MTLKTQLQRLPSWLFLPLLLILGSRLAHADTHFSDHQNALGVISVQRLGTSSPAATYRISSTDKPIVVLRTKEFRHPCRK
jgi:hypothetical protein